MSNIKTDNTMALYHALNRIDELEALNEKLGEALKEKMICGEGAYVLRKQAEAFEAFVKAWRSSDEAEEWFTVSPEGLHDYAQRLRNQADELEKGERDE